MNFFDTLNTYTATADAHYVEEIDKQEVRRFERLVDADVRGAYANAAASCTRERAPLMAARDVARDNLTIIEGRYKNGDALIIEYLDAQIELVNAELQPGRRHRAAYSCSGSSCRRRSASPSEWTMANGARKRRRWLAPAISWHLARRVAQSCTSRRGGAGPKELDPSLITTVKRGDLAIEVLETGKVQPREKVEIKSKVAGQVAKVFVDEGDKVKKGQLLLQLDPTDYERDVAPSARPTWRRRKNALEFSELSLDRRQKGLEARGVAQMDVDTAAGRRARPRRWRVQTAMVALNAASDRLRYTRDLVADGRHGHRARHPAGRGGDAGRAGDVRGQVAADHLGSVDAAREGRPQPDRRRQGEDGSEGDGHARRAAGQDLRSRRSPRSRRRRSCRRTSRSTCSPSRRR